MARKKHETCKVSSHSISKALKNDIKEGGKYLKDYFSEFVKKKGDVDEIDVEAEDYAFVFRDFGIDNLDSICGCDRDVKKLVITSPWDKYITASMPLWAGIYTGYYSIGIYTMYKDMENELPGCVSNFKNLKEARIGWAGLESIDALEGTPVKKVTARYNNIKKLPNLNEMKKLETLDLVGNKVKGVECGDEIISLRKALGKKEIKKIRKCQARGEDRYWMKIPVKSIGDLFEEVFEYAGEIAIEERLDMAEPVEVNEEFGKFEDLECKMKEIKGEPFYSCSKEGDEYIGSFIDVVAPEPLRRESVWGEAFKEISPGGKGEYECKGVTGDMLFCSFKEGMEMVDEGTGWSEIWTGEKNPTVE